MGKRVNDLRSKIINILLDILIFIFGIILLVSIYNGIQIKILGNDYASFFGLSIFEVQTGSMSTTINAGDWIVVRQTNNLALNDIITYEQDGNYITHRIKEAYKDTFITQGDANPSKDEPINKEQVVGKVVKILPLFGIFRKTLFNPWVLLTLIFTLFLINVLFKKDKKGSEDKGFRSDIERKCYKMIQYIIKKIKTLINNIKKNSEEKKSVRKTAPKEVKTLKEVKTETLKEEKPEIKEDVPKVELVSGGTDEKLDIHSELKEYDEDELDKTLYFRNVLVDMSDASATLSEIENNKSLDDEDDELITVSEPIQTDDEEEEKAELDLELLKKSKNKKCKNIIDKIMFIKSEEINSIINVLDDEEKMKVNEATIKDTFNDEYIAARYYNYGGSSEDTRNITSRINDILEQLSNKLIKEYKGTDNKYSSKVEKYLEIYNLVSHLEQSRDVVTEIKPKRELYKKKLIKYANSEAWDAITLSKSVDEIIKIQKKFQAMANYTLEKLDTTLFSLVFSKVTSRKYMHGVSLDHNLEFSKVYSDYIVDKTYNEGIIGEDKITVLLTLLQSRLSKDMLSGEFDNKYIIYILESLYEKDNKLDKLLRMIEDEYAMNSVIILVNYDELLAHKQVIKKYRKKGYKFAIAFDDDVDIKAKDKGNIYIADYVFINDEKVDKNKILNCIPDDIKDKVIYDNIVEKVGDFGGE